MKIFNIKKYIFVAIITCGIFSPATKTEAKLLLMPTYAIFDGRERTEDITIVNTSDKTGQYRVKWLHYKQNNTGSYDQQDTPINPAFDPDKMVVFSPRQVTLPPKARQRVRMSLRRPPNMPDGEYRAHLQLQSIGSPDDYIKTTTGGLKTQVAVNVGFSIPVIVRQGAYNASVTITNPHFIQPNANGKDKRPRLGVTLKREGIHGTMGRLRAFWTPPDEDEREIGIQNNVNIFTEINERSAAIPLRENAINAGTLRILYEGVGIDKGKKFAESVLPIGQ